MSTGPKIIGIGGISRSGKSFLAREVASFLSGSERGVKVLDQDDFVMPEGRIPVIRNHVDWESPDSIDFEKFKTAITDSAQKHDFVIAEGLMVFWYPDVFQLFDYTIFIQLNRAEFIMRKQSDLRWGEEPDWYIDHIW